MVACRFGFALLTFLANALRLGTLDTLVLRPTVTRTVNGYPRVRVARQLHNFVLARHFAAEFVYTRVYGTNAPVHRTGFGWVVGSLVVLLCGTRDRGE